MSGGSSECEVGEDVRAYLKELDEAKTEPLGRGDESVGASARWPGMIGLGGWACGQRVLALGVLLSFFVVEFGVAYFLFRYLL